MMHDMSFYFLLQDLIRLPWEGCKDERKKHLSVLWHQFYSNRYNLRVHFEDMIIELGPSTVHPRLSEEDFLFGW